MTRLSWLSISTPTSMAYIVDGVLGTFVTNPLVSCTLLAGLGLYSMGLSVHMFRNYGTQVFIESTSRYGLDICHHILNVIFIWRFPAASKKGLLVQSNLGFETLLWLSSNAVALYMMSNSKAWLGCDGNVFFRVIMWSSLICPYAIFVVDITDVFLNSRENKETEKSPILAMYQKQGSEPETAKTELALTETSRNSKTSKTSKITKVLVDTNNAFLAVFIAQSFAHIRVEAPFIESSFLNSIYILCSYLFKLHLVHMFVLYETVVAVFELVDLSAYSELYMPVSLGCVKRWPQRMRDSYAVVMTAWTGVIMAYDMVLLVLASL